ncbi:MAG: Hpt domain-containing protein [Pseudomonadales bacterium]
MDTVEFRNTLLQAFSEEAPDLLGKAEKSFFDLDEADEFDQVSHCESLKRALHSFKGSASAIGRADIRDVCHAMEDMVLLIAQDQKLPERMDALQFGLQFLHIAAANPADSLDPENILSVLSNPALLQQIISTTDEPETPADEISEETATAQQKETETTKNTESQKNIAQSPTPNAVSDITSALSETIRVSISKIENMQSNVGEMVAIRLQQDDSLSLLNDLQRHVASMATQWRTLGSEIREFKQHLSPTLSVKLDSRVSTFTAAVKQAERQLFHLSQQMGSQTGQLSLLCDAMDTGLRAIRMMPLGPFLESFRATARDAARSLGKSHTGV